MLCGKNSLSYCFQSINDEMCTNGASKFASIVLPGQQTLTQRKHDTQVLFFKVNIRIVKHTQDVIYFIYH